MDADFTAEDDEAGHKRHFVEPVVSVEYVPDTQFVQTDASATANVPAPHATHVPLTLT
jgi:hypothetical protein